MLGGRRNEPGRDHHDKAQDDCLRSDDGPQLLMKHRVVGVGVERRQKSEVVVGAADDRQACSCSLEQ